MEKISEKDIRDISNPATNLLPAHLERLYQALGLNHSEIAIAKQEATATDVRSRAENVLMKWVQKKGYEATRREIIEGLTRAHLIAAKEHLEVTWGLATHELTNVLDEDIRYLTYHTYLRHEELHNLFRALGLTSIEIEDIETAADKNVRLMAIAVFNEWRMKNGWKASRESIIDALMKCKLGSVQGMLEEKWDLPSRGNLTTLDLTDKMIVEGECDILGERENTRMHISEKIQTWRSRLADIYLRDRNEVRLGRGSLHTAHLDDLFVDLILIEEKCFGSRRGMQVLERIRLKEQAIGFEKYDQVEGIQGVDIGIRNKSNRRKLNSYLDLFQMKIKDQQANHFLLFGAAGTGKTTQINKIAFEWAKNVKNESECGSSRQLLDAMELVIVLDVSRFMNRENIVHALAKEIQMQLLPSATIHDIGRVFDHLGYKCLVIFDGFDELHYGVKKHALDCPHVQSLFSITTTRPHVKDIFCMKYKGYTQIQVSGFSGENIARYITMFFDISGEKYLAPSLIEQVEANLLLQSMSSFPILLVMICLVWGKNNGRDITFQSMTSLYKEIMTKQCFNKLFEEREQLSGKEVENVILSLGKHSLEALLQTSIVMQERHFDKTFLNKAIGLGLMIKDEGSLPGETFVRFIHKTFQEYCAAVYLCSLFAHEKNKKHFQEYLIRINSELKEQMEYVLRFCCGLSIEAALDIFRHIVCIEKTSKNPWRFPLIMLYEVEVTHKLPIQLEQKFYRDLESLSQMTEIHATDADFLSAIRYFSNDKHKLSHSCFKSITRFDSQYEKAEQQHIVQILNKMPSLEKAVVCMRSLYSEENLVVRTLSKLSTLGLSVLEPVGPKCVSTFVQDMPVLETLCLDAVEIFDDIHYNNTNVPLHKCITNVVIGNLHAVIGNLDEHITVTMVKVNIRTLLKLLNSMPALSMLALINPNLTDELNDQYVDLSDSLKEFQFACDLTDKKCKANVQGTQLIGEIVIESLKEFSLAGNLLSREYTFNVSQLVRFLGCMPALTEIKLQDAQLIGILEDTHVTLTESLKEFILVGSIPDREYNINISQLVRLLGCMPALTKVHVQDAQLIGILEDTHVTLSQSLKEFVLVGKFPDREYNVNISQLVRFLGCMPALTKIKLQDAQLIGILEDTHVTLTESLKEFILMVSIPDREYNINISQLVRFLGCMPALTKVHVQDAQLIGVLEDTHVTLSQSLKEFVLVGKFPDREYNVNISQLVSFLGCMPALTKVYVQDVQLIGILEDTHVTLSESLKKILLMGSIPEREYNVNISQLVRFLGCMPALTKVHVEGAQLIGILEDTHVTLTESLKEFILMGSIPDREYNINISQLVSFLGCMPALTKVKVYDAQLIGILEDTHVTLSQSLKEFVLVGKFPDREYNVNMSQLVRFLGCMPALTKIKLQDAQLIGILEDTHVTLTESLKEFILMVSIPDREYNINISQLVRFLGCMPALTKVHVQDAQLIGVLEDTHVTLSQSLKEFVLVGKFPDREYNVNISQLVSFLGCMPALTKVKVYDAQLIGILEDTHVTLSQSLKEFVLVGKFPDREYNVNMSQLVRFLGCMPALTKIKLQDAQLIGILEDTHVTLTESLKEFILMVSIPDREYNINISQLVRFLGCMPALTKVHVQDAQLIGVLEDTHVTLSQSLKEFVLVGKFPDREYNVNISQLVSFLGCMPALTKVYVQDVQLIGILEDTHVTLSESLKKILLMGSIPEREYNVNISQLVRFLGCMPALTKVHVEGAQLIGILEDTHVTLTESLKEFILMGSIPDREYNINISQLVSFLGCMPALTKVKVYDAQLIGILEDTHVTLSQSLKEFVLVGKFPDREYNVNMSQLVRFLGCMPALTEVHVQDAQLIGILEDTHVTLTESLKEFILMGNIPETEYNVNISQLVRFLSCMPVLTEVSLWDTHLTGELHDPHVTIESVKEFWLIGKFPDTKYNVDITQLAKFLTCIPAVKKVIIQDTHFTGKLDNRFVPWSETVEEYALQHVQSVLPDREYNVNISQLIGYLVCMPGLTRVILQDTHLIGDLNESSVTWIQSINELWLVNWLVNKDYDVSVSQLIRFMQRIPALATVVLGTIHNTEKLDCSHSTLREHLQKDIKFVHRLSNGENSLSVSQLLCFIGRILPDVVRQEFNDCHVTLIETLRQCVLIDEHETDIKQCVVEAYDDTGTFYRSSATNFDRLLRCIPGLEK